MKKRYRNEALNGIPRLADLHLTGHNLYNNKVRQILDGLHYDNMPFDEAFNHVKGLTNHIRDLINTNPNLNSGQIADLIQYP